MLASGNASRSVHEHFGENLKYSQRIGATHWDAGGDDGDLPGPRREFFFAPAQIQKRIGEWGRQEFQERVGTSWADFRDSSGRWLRVERGYGREAVQRIYQATLEGSARPERGNVLSLWEDAEVAAGR